MKASFQHAVSMLRDLWKMNLPARQEAQGIEQEGLEAARKELNDSTAMLRVEQDQLHQWQQHLCAQEDRVAAQLRQLFTLAKGLPGFTAEPLIDVDYPETILATIGKAVAAFEKHIEAERTRLKDWEGQRAKSESISRWQAQHYRLKTIIAPGHAVLNPPTSKDGYYVLSLELKRLFDDLVSRPYKELRHSPLWLEAHVESNHHEIIARGQADFCTPVRGLPPEDLVLLYCQSNMRMHFFSSYHIFYKHREHLQAAVLEDSKHVLFVDIGCGPMTSGLAFSAFAKSLGGLRHLTYVGVDRAPAMLTKAVAFNRYEGGYFDKFVTCEDYYQLPYILGEQLGTHEPVALIFNMSYFLASPTLQAIDFTAMLRYLSALYRHCRIAFIIQEPANFSPSERSKRIFLNQFAHFDHFVKDTVEEIRYKLVNEKKVTVKYSILTRLLC